MSDCPENTPKDDELCKAIQEIIRLNQIFSNFWGRLEDLPPSDFPEWAPESEAMNLLTDVFFEVQVSLSYRLNDIFSSNSKEEALGKLITLWAVLGMLVENTLKFFLVVYIYDARKSMTEKEADNFIKDHMTFSQLIEFLKKLKIFEIEEYDYISWIDKIRENRNSIHSFKKKEIGTLEKLYQDILVYHQFLELVKTRLPWPR